VATKSGAQEPERAEVIEELLDALDTAIDRVKVLYEQYFLGIQKQPPTYLHTDIERKIRDLTQIQVRNTAMRYRFATLQQKFGSYNAYWRRTLRQIESGTYARNLSKVGRQAVKTGADVPAEILAAMPKRMREQVKRDREAALALSRLRDRPDPADPGASGLLTLAPGAGIELDLEDLDPAAFIRESSELRRNLLRARAAFQVDDADADFDLDAFFASVTSEDTPMSPLQVPRPTGGPGVAAQGSRSAPAGNPALGAADPPRAPSVAAARDAAGGRGPGPLAAPPRVTGPPEAAPVEIVRETTRQFALPTRVPASRPQPPPAPTATSRPTPARPTIAPPPVGSSIGSAPSQATRPLPVTPGAAAARPPTPIETLSGPFPRLPRLPSLPSNLRGKAGPGGAESVEPAPPTSELPARAPRPVGARPSPPARPSTPARDRRDPEPPQRPPAGMSDADVNVLYASYVKAKQLVGEDAGPGAYSKLLRSINAEAPKIMAQYGASGVDFSVVVKDNQVIVRAKPRP
jgi:hypothetical protein